jgi:hypothetical protein
VELDPDWSNEAHDTLARLLQNFNLKTVFLLLKDFQDAVQLTVNDISLSDADIGSSGSDLSWMIGVTQNVDE